MQYVAFQKLSDTGAVASSLAAKIYGLNILAEDIQVLIFVCSFVVWCWIFVRTLSFDMHPHFDRMIVIMLLDFSCWPGNLLFLV